MPGPEPLEPGRRPRRRRRRGGSRRGWRRRSTGHRRVWTCSFWSRPRRAARRARARASRTTSDSRRASPGRTLRAAHSCRRRNSARSSSSRGRRWRSSATAGPIGSASAPAVRVAARTVVIATGVKYRKPDIPNLARFEGVGVYYGATPVEEMLCRGEDVIVVGGANSAGQAAIFLSRRQAACLHARPRSGALRHDVALPDPPDRGDAEHRAQDRIPGSSRSKAQIAWRV